MTKAPPRMDPVAERAHGLVRPKGSLSVHVPPMRPLQASSPLPFCYAVRSGAGEQVVQLSMCLRLYGANRGTNVAPNLYEPCPKANCIEGSVSECALLCSPSAMHFSLASSADCPMHLQNLSPCEHSITSPSTSACMRVRGGGQGGGRRALRSSMDAGVTALGAVNTGELPRQRSAWGNAECIPVWHAPHPAAPHVSSGEHHPTFHHHLASLVTGTSTVSHPTDVTRVAGLYIPSDLTPFSARTPHLNLRPAPDPTPDFDPSLSPLNWAHGVAACMPFPQQQPSTPAPYPVMPHGRDDEGGSTDFVLLDEGRTITSKDEWRAASIRGIRNSPIIEQFIAHYMQQKGSQLAMVLLGTPQARLHHDLPLRRITRIMADTAWPQRIRLCEGTSAMLSQAASALVGLLTQLAWQVSSQPASRKVLMLKDIKLACASSKRFDFLMDVNDMFVDPNPSRRRGSEKGQSVPLCENGCWP